MLRSRFLLRVGLAVAFALSFGAISASADTTQDYTLVNGNAGGIGLFPGPYATVHISLNTAGTVATITFTGLTQGGNVYTIGGAQAVDINTNGTASLVSGSISWTGGNGNTAFSTGGSGNADGWGTFNFRLNNFDGQNSSVNSVTFQISGSWSNASSVLTNNTNGFLAAAHIFSSTSIGGINTGYASNGNVAPEPSTMAIAGLGALGLVGYGLRRRVKKW